MIKPRLLATPMFLILLLCSLQTAATSVLPISLQRMAIKAEIIFHGTAINNEVKLDQASGRVATYTTFKVSEVIKGNPGATHTIKQIGGQLPGSQVRQIIHGVPQFSPGQDYVVFLPKASSLGFSSPIGLSQGKFDVHKHDGKSVINNQRAVAAVSDTPAQQILTEVPSAIEADQSAGERSVHLTDFLQSLRTMVKE